MAYNVFTDSIDVKTTIDPESLRDRTAAIFGPTTKQVLDATLHVDKSVAGRSFRLAGRLADSAPFFGRAKAFFPSQDCSTGFYVNSATNGTVMLSAGQCGTNGQTVRNGNQTLTVGTVEGRRFPNPDLLVIDGQLYSARSFSANNTTSSKAIRSSNNPTTGVTYCQMGFVSQRICSTYSSLSAQYCDESGCTTGLAFTSRACTSPLGQPGDSGGGVFKEMADGTLGARGTVVAGAQISPTQCARYDHRLTTILSTYDAVVVVS